MDNNYIDLREPHSLFSLMRSQKDAVSDDQSNMIFGSKLTDHTVNDPSITQFKPQINTYARPRMDEDSNAFNTTPHSVFVDFTQVTYRNALASGQIYINPSITQCSSLLAHLRTYNAEFPLNRMTNNEPYAFDLITEPALSDHTRDPSIDSTIDSTCVPLCVLLCLIRNIYDVSASRSMSRSMPLFLWIFLLISFTIQATPSNAGYTDSSRLVAERDSGDMFGSAVSMYGDYVAVGAYKQNTYQGAVYMFSKSGDETWSLDTKLTGASLGGWFGYAVSMYGDYLAIGAPSGRMSIEGVRIFRKNSDATWTQLQDITLDVDDYDSYDFSFGWAVSMHADYLIIGTKADSGPAHGIDPGPGSAYIYSKHTNGIWIQDAKLTAADGIDGADFGFAVAMYGDYAAVGDKSSTYIFRRYNDGTWIQDTKLTGEGSTLSMNADYLVVGRGSRSAPYTTYSGTPPVYIFRKSNDGVWSEDAKLTSTAFPGFGSTVSLYDDCVAVGQIHVNYPWRSGAAYIFRKRNNGSWSQDAYLRAPSPSPTAYFGSWVSLYDYSLAVGAYGESGGKGAVYVYSIPTPSPTDTPTLEPTLEPTVNPTLEPTTPTYDPTEQPTTPTYDPTYDPTNDPTIQPTIDPTVAPTTTTHVPTKQPTYDPTSDPTNDPTIQPTVATIEPSVVPSLNPTNYPTNPTLRPTNKPSEDQVMYGTETSSWIDASAGAGEHTSHASLSVFWRIFAISSGIVFVICLVSCFSGYKYRQYTAVRTVDDDDDTDIDADAQTEDM